MTRRLMLLIGLLATGCTRVDVNHHAVLPATGLEALHARLDRGTLVWSGTASNAQIDVDVWSWAAGSGGRGAKRVEQSNDWGILVEDGTAELWGTSRSGRAGVDFSAAGPGRIDVDAVTGEGEIAVESINGDVLITADRTVARGVSGSADLFAWTTGVDAVVRPSPGDLVRIHAVSGDVFLGLPAGLDYDLRIDVPPAYGHDVIDLGFDWYAATYQHFEAGRGDQSIPVRITTEGGSVIVYQVEP